MALPVKDGSPESDEAARRAASLWYERFEQPRRTRSPSLLLQRLLVWLLLAVAAGLLYHGLTDRGRRLRELSSPSSIDLPDDAQLSRALELDSASGRLFFPRWKEWRRRDGELAARRTECLGTLESLAAQRQDLNAEQERLLGELESIAARRLALRTQLVQEVRRELGLWRAAQLAVLLEPLGN
jgi:hypothetical protein